MNLRKNQSSLNASEKKAFTNAVLELKQKPSRLHPGDLNFGRYDDFVDVHLNAMMPPIDAPSQAEAVTTVTLKFAPIDPLTPASPWTSILLEPLLTAVASPQSTSRRLLRVYAIEDVPKSIAVNRER
jgi:hypothetical protein